MEGTVTSAVSSWSPQPASCRHVRALRSIFIDLHPEAFGQRHPLGVAVSSSTKLTAHMFSVAAAAGARNRTEIKRLPHLPDRTSRARGAPQATSARTCCRRPMWVSHRAVIVAGMNATNHTNDYFRIVDLNPNTAAGAPGGQRPARPPGPVLVRVPRAGPAPGPRVRHQPASARPPRPLHVGLRLLHRSRHPPGDVGGQAARHPADAGRALQHGADARGSPRAPVRGAVDRPHRSATDHRPGGPDQRQGVARGLITPRTRCRRAGRSSCTPPRSPA